jgi:hypothetical protein
MGQNIGTRQPYYGRNVCIKMKIPIIDISFNLNKQSGVPNIIQVINAADKYGLEAEKGGFRFRAGGPDMPPRIHLTLHAPDSKVASAAAKEIGPMAQVRFYYDEDFDPYGRHRKYHIPLTIPLDQAAKMLGSAIKWVYAPDYDGSAPPGFRRLY